ncbi:hypothetical protein MTP99_015086 [Tenebrio molitor]|nr:hypothetical protein MTP99_015086 [Tenebrio molitor]
MSGASYAMVSLIAIIKLTQTETCREKLDCWSEDSGSRETFLRIKRDARRATIYTILNTVLSIAVGVTLVLPNEDEIHYHYFLKILAEQTPPNFITQTLYYAYKINFVFLFFVMTVNSIRILYVSRQIKFQSYLLLEHLGNISEGYDVDDLNIFYNEEYHKEVNNKLKFCIRRHLHIAQFAKENNDAVKSFIIPFAITATLLGMTVLLIGFTGTIYYNYYQIILSAVLYLSTLFCAVEGSQCVEEETDKFSQVLFSNPWYTWNRENKKLLCIFLTITHEPIKMLKWSETLYLNYDWAISVLKKVYSLGSVFFNMRGYITK